MYLARKERKDCLKWTEVVFGSKPDPKKGKPIINAELSSIFEELLDKQEGRELRWTELENLSEGMVQIRDSSMDNALTRALEEGRRRFTRKEFDNSFDFKYQKDAQNRTTKPGPPKFSYDSYMKVGKKYFSPQKLLRIDFTPEATPYLFLGFDVAFLRFWPHAQLKDKVTCPRARQILEQTPNKFDYIKVGKTYFSPIDEDKGHGLTWKYQKFDTGKFKVVNGETVEVQVSKPITGITNHYRLFVVFVILCKFAIAIGLCIFGAGWILLGDEGAGDMILNTLASVFIFTVDEIVYKAVTPTVGMAIVNDEYHTITFCARERSQRFNNTWRSSAFVACFLPVATVVLNFQVWKCVDG